MEDREDKEGETRPFLLFFLKREDEREKIEKNANQKHFLQKNSFILFFERQKFVKMSENSKNTSLFF